MPERILAGLRLVTSGQCEQISAPLAQVLLDLGLVSDLHRPLRLTAAGRARVHRDGRESKTVR
ncbi:MAG: hypothetical protein ABW136_10250 [Steroidobacteraceae bacterium]